MRPERRMRFSVRRTRSCAVSSKAFPIRRSTIFDMDKKGLEWKVGAFVLIGLVLLALLALGFSQGMSFFRPSYKIHLHAANIGGLKTTAYVLMAGVRVGTV